MFGKYGTIEWEKRMLLSTGIEHCHYRRVEEDPFFLNSLDAVNMAKGELSMSGDCEDIVWNFVPIARDCSWLNSTHVEWYSSPAKSIWPDK